MIAGIFRSNYIELTNFPEMANLVKGIAPDVKWEDRQQVQLVSELLSKEQAQNLANQMSKVIKTVSTYEHFPVLKSRSDTSKYRVVAMLKDMHNDLSLRDKKPEDFATVQFSSAEAEYSMINNFLMG